MSAIRKFLMAVIGVLFVAPAFATPAWIDYSPDAFKKAQNAEETILVDVSADWCPTCKAQHPTLEELRADPALRDVVFIKVDFDTHKDFLRAHNIPRQSTIVVFKGGAEVDRSIAETDRDRLRDFVFNAVEG